MYKGSQALLWPDSQTSQSSASGRLRAWEPENWFVAEDWRSLVERFFASNEGRELGRALSDRLAKGAVVYPPDPLRALGLTPLQRVRVLILGQDPYHGPGQAEGLAFSVATGMKCPPSLANIFKEIAREFSPPRTSITSPLAPAPARKAGSLVSWAQQGVLLLNTCLTVEQGSPASHAKLGWRALTVEIFKSVVKLQTPTVFMLWGAQAQQFADLVREFGDPCERLGENGRHLILQANHPSPLSALRPPLPFIGCGHFGQANAFLSSRLCSPIDWKS